ncbi:phosphoribosyl-ATP diphosphatase [Phaeovibrio sulfidiphilus]|uniref:Phosphoribosyl-ATP pyrophosphatase n=1 Tax=Phaeovibrio sulfidiphilus TaxID=1220600 RepID=A0A8J6YLG4_9PROT|nr:phosphoribosyl-ATP diphosphatase [Phaeovibrio sulfidiphilus]MBE1236575.1 phosphoribosyl-ATP diphosphatase [Phaeovibrio sulfidiphilus]
MTERSSGLPHVLDRLHSVVLSRKGADDSTSYTARLFSKGRVKITNKMGEEAFEVASAALAQGPDEVVSESADLLYHLTVLWADVGVDPQRVWAELEARFGMSGLEEKASRPDAGR